MKRKTCRAATARWSRSGARPWSRWRRAARGCGAEVEAAAPPRPPRTPCAPRPASRRRAPCVPTTPSSRWPPSGPRRRWTGAWTRAPRPPRRAPPPRPRLRSPMTSSSRPATRRLHVTIAQLVWMIVHLGLSS